LLSKIGVCVTNGGYGGIDQVLSFGALLVTAGHTEGKADISVHVAWLGVGINFATIDRRAEIIRIVKQVALNG
jgi:hypothetical protein